MGTYINTYYVAGLFLLIFVGITFFLIRRERKIAVPSGVAAPFHVAQPVINVIFSSESAEDVSDSLADMFIQNRIYFYSGRPLPANVQHEIDEDKVFVRYSEIDFSNYIEIKV
ncbi:MAG: hypothetical protein LBJ72_01625 [Dysgonamonadaceae bacterium]|jgi:hypothetical protein|nr:hypothetical protein [Dysgonamonadaceae bacterium]